MRSGLITVGLAALGLLGAGAAPAEQKAAAQKAVAPQPITLGNVSGQVPGSWTAQPPAGQFRLLQYGIPKAAGDTAVAQAIVFHFGKGGGGSVEDNARRWMGMMRPPEGKKIEEVTTLNKTERPGLKITSLDIRGTYLERPFPMSPEATPRPNYRMLAAIVETTTEAGDGPYFIRLVGPAKSVDAAKPGWDSLLASLRVE